jgi:hypothetical protein
MAQLDGPADEGLAPPDPDALLIAQRKAEILAEAGVVTPQPTAPDPDALLEKRRAEVKEAAAKAEKEPVLTQDEEDETVDLINAGKKDVVFELFGRTIHLRTLTIEEELKVSEITKQYLQTDGYPRAYRTAIVAAAIRTIDGELLFNPISETDFDQMIAKKFQKLLDYYPLAVDQIYARYRDLELELLALVEKLGKSSG